MTDGCQIGGAAGAVFSFLVEGWGNTDQWFFHGQDTSFYNKCPFRLPEGALCMIL